LRSVWYCMERLLRGSADSKREDQGELKDLAKGLLQATRGPDMPKFDPREPYRKEFVAVIRQLQSASARDLASALSAAATGEAESLKKVQEVPADALRDLDTSAAEARDARGRIRMDSEIVAGVGRGAKPFVTPSWVFDQNLSPEAWKGLKASGVINNASDLERVSNEGPVPHIWQSAQQESVDQRLCFARLHAAWLRGWCAQRQDAFVGQVQRALQIDAVKSFPSKGVGNAEIRLFRSRTEVKGLPRILEKMVEALDEEVSNDKAKQLLDGKLDDAPNALRAKRELLTPAAYVADITGAEVVVSTFTDLIALYEAISAMTLEKHGCQLVRTKNGFSSQLKEADVQAKGGYRDLKLWVAFQAPNQAAEPPMIVEMQLHVISFYVLKKAMHLPYEASRGSLDHAHLFHFWEKPHTKKCCCVVM